MEIHVDRNSEIPVHEQLSAQFVFLIGTGRLKPGAFLPSVRALAQRLSIHRNTVSRAYHDLTLGYLVERRAGRRLAIRQVNSAIPASGHDLDELVELAVIQASRRGYSIQQLHGRLGERLRAAPPDHLLVLSEDAGMRMLLPFELRHHVSCPVHACTPDELMAHRERLPGALVISPQGHIPRIRPVLSPRRPAIPITYSAADGILNAIRQLRKPSVIAVVSVSSYLLKMAQTLFAPAVGKRHSIAAHLMTGDGRVRTGGADLIVCDVVSHSLMHQRYKAGSVIVYTVLSRACLDMVSAAVGRRCPRRVATLD